MRSALDIHRLLDEAFTGIDVTPDVQDLKEEVRANLVARVAELEGGGVAPLEAARRAMAELGDVRAIVGEMPAGPAEASGAAQAGTRHRVRPRPAFVVRCALLVPAGVGALAVALDTVTRGQHQPHVFHLGEPERVASFIVLALASGLIVGDALRQETTTNYPVPPRRALGYGLATALGVLGLGSAAISTTPLIPMPQLFTTAPLIVASIMAFAYLGATQTNRHKPWAVRERRRQEELGDRFSQDPAAAARFGMYFGAILLVALAGFGILGVTVGWAWSWLALLAGLVAMMLTLARMLFGPTGGTPASRPVAGSAPPSGS
jgi:hypothetical protein